MTASLGSVTSLGSKFIETYSVRFALFSFTSFRSAAGCSIKVSIVYGTSAMVTIVEVLFP